MKPTFKGLLCSVFALTCVYVEAQTQTLYTDADFASRTLDQTLAVGRTDFSASVNQVGAAVVSIPISVPPGTNGMQPHLSVSYNSMGGNGICGYGWDLSGLSAITRGKTGVAISLTAYDYFALDGMTLYQKDYKDYTFITKQESYTEIKSYGELIGESSSYFIVSN